MAAKLTRLTQKIAIQLRLVAEVYHLQLLLQAARQNIIWILFEKLIVSQLLKKYPTFFMEHEGSSPCSQKPTIGPSPEPAESSSPHRSLSP
jgi:hypothetical protein